MLNLGKNIHAEVFKKSYTDIWNLLWMHEK